MRIQRFGAYFGSFCLIAAITVSPLKSAQKFAVVIGVAKYQDYGTPWLQFADRDADLFTTYLSRVGVPASNVTVVKDELATTASMRENLRHVLVEEANAGDAVYVFVSGRGLATHYYRGGFVLGYLSRLDHPISTALTTEDIEQLVQQSKADIYVFADLDRDPPGPQPENTIQLAMKSVWQIHPKMGVLLASAPGERSLERKDLGGGHGVFGYYLVKELGSRALGERPGEVTMESLFQKLQNELSQSSGRKQSPFALPPEKSTRKSSFFRPLNQILVQASYRTDSTGDDGIHHKSARGSLSREEFAAAARRSSPDELIARYRLGTSEEESEQRQKYEVALEDKGEEVFASYGDCRECLQEGATDRLTRKDYERAQRSFEFAASLAPDGRLRSVLEAKRHWAEGRILTLDGKYSEAETLLTNAIGVFPTMPELSNALGTAYLEHARYPDAVTAFQEAVNEANDWSYARHNLAVAYIRSSNYTAAEREYRDAIARAPEEPSLHLNLGMLLQQQSRPNEAEQEYTQALQICRKQQQGAAKREKAWATHPTDLLAVDETQKEAALHSTFARETAEVHNAFGALLESQGKLESAGRELGEAVRLNPHLVIARYQLARVNYELADGEPTARAGNHAVQEWRQTLEESPDYVPSRIRLAEAYEDEKNFAEAAQEYHEVLKAVNSPVIRALEQQASGDASLKEENRPRACEFYRKAEKEITAADCAGEYRDLLLLQNAFFAADARQNPSPDAYVRGNAFLFQPCRWNHEVLTNVRLDARSVLYLKLNRYCVQNLPARSRGDLVAPLVSPLFFPVRGDCLNCGIRGNSSAVPEPSTLYLVALAAGMVFLMRQRQRRSRRKDQRL